MGGQRHIPTATSPKKRSGTDSTGGWVGPRAGIWRKQNSLAPTGIRTANCPACRQSLYRLSYPSPHTHTIILLSVTFKKHKLQRGISGQMPGVSVFSMCSVQDVSDAQRSGSSLKDPLNLRFVIHARSVNPSVSDDPGRGSRNFYVNRKLYRFIFHASYHGPNT